MSISTTQFGENSKETFYSKKHFKRIIDTSLKSVKTDMLNIPIAFSIMITAIAEAVGVELSIKWYSLLFFMIILFIFNQKKDVGTKTK